jgi:sporulation protein YlmC with PRC-barrel domain
MKWLKTCAVLIAVGSLLLTTASFAAKNERADIYRASKLIGGDVENLQGEKLGDIKDVVLDPETGRITYAVLSFGGFMGMGEKYFAIPWAALTSKGGEKGDFVLNVEKEKLKNAPGFDKNSWPNMADRHWAEQVYTYYGITPYWEHHTAKVPESTPRMGGMEHGTTITATVQNVDQSTKLIRLRTVHNEIVELQAPAGLLGQLHGGDRVEVAIRKQAVVTPPTVVPPSK